MILSQYSSVVWCSLLLVDLDMSHQFWATLHICALGTFLESCLPLQLAVHNVLPGRLAVAFCTSWLIVFVSCIKKLRSQEETVVDRGVHHILGLAGCAFLAQVSKSIVKLSQAICFMNEAAVRVTMEETFGPALAGTIYNCIVYLVTSLDPKAMP